MNKFKTQSSSEIAHHRRNFQKFHLVFILLILLFLFLRMDQLSLEGFSPCEEGFNHILTNRTLTENLEVCLDSNQHPLPIFLQKIWHQFLPHTKYHARLLTVLTSMLSILAVGFLALELFGQRVAIYSLIFYGLSISHLLHSRIIREYPLLMLFTTLFLLFYFRYQNKQQWSSFAIMQFFLILALHTHYAAFAILPTLLVIELFPKNKNKFTLSKILWLFLPPLVASLPWLFTLIHTHGNAVFHLYKSTGSFYENHYGLSGILAPVWLFLARDRLFDVNDTSIMVVALVLFASILSLIRWRQKEDERILQLWLFLAIPVGIALVIFNLLGRDDLLKSRYFLAFLPTFSIALAVGVRGLRRRFHQFIFFLLFIPLVISLFYQQINGDTEFQTCQDLFQAMERRATSETTLLLEPPLIADIQFALPTKNQYLTLRQHHPFGAFTDQYVFSKVSTTAEIVDKLKNVKHLVYGFYPYFDEAIDGNPLRDILEKDFQVKEEISIGSGRITVYEKK